MNACIQVCVYIMEYIVPCTKWMITKVCLFSIQKCAIDDDSPSFTVNDESVNTTVMVEPCTTTLSKDTEKDEAGEAVKETVITTVHQEKMDGADGIPEASSFVLAKRLSCKWTTGAGPRIGCVRDYPTELQSRALEHVNLSPRVTNGPIGNYGPIPSPRPSPKVRVSPRLSYMGLPSPRTPIPAN